MTNASVEAVLLFVEAEAPMSRLRAWLAPVISSKDADEEAGDREHDHDFAEVLKHDDEGLLWPEIQW